MHGSVIEHYQRDFAVRAAAGITMSQLQDQLAPHDQFLPVDADPDLTLGEVILHNVYGPLRVGYGSIRDLLLGLHYIDGQGRDIHVGGRTVKNVAGYDVTRFMVGSLGQFGIVHEATVRTYAIPEQATAVDVQMEDPTSIDKLLTRWLQTDAAPVHMSMQADNGDWRLRVGYFGQRSSCSAQQCALESFVQEASTLRIGDAVDYDLAADTADRAARRRWRRQAAALVKVIVPPAATGTTSKKLTDWSKENRIQLRVEALPAHGCVFAGGGLDAGTAGQLDQHIGASLNGPAQRVWYARPTGAEAIEPFSPPQNDWPILARLKRTMDPQNLLNPNRFIRLDEKP